MMDETSRAALMEEMAQDSATGGGCYLTRHAALVELNELQDEKSVEPRHAQFLRFCEHVVVGYAGMTDRQIADAAETPALIRYLLKALANYERRVGNLPSSKNEAHKRRMVLADAFGLTGGHGGDRQSLWTLERQMRALKSYTGKLHSYGQERDTEPARRAAIFAAYEDIFGPAFRHEHRQMRTNLKGLLRVLRGHGYLRHGDLTAQSK